MYEILLCLPPEDKVVDRQTTRSISLSDTWGGHLLQPNEAGD